METENLNTPVDNVATSNDGSGRVETDATGGPLTFDELEQALGDKKKKKVGTEPAPKAKGKDDDSEPKKEKKPKQDKSESKEDHEDTEDGEEPKAKEEPARKKIKAKYADDELDIDEEALVPVKVNGKDEFVQVKDLLSNYSGKTAWDQKFTEVHKMKKEALNYQSKLDETAKAIQAIYNEQDPDMRMFKMAQVAGLNPIEFRQKFFDGNISLLDKYYNMTDDERKADALAFEAKFHKHRADTLDAQSKQEQSYKELSAKVSDIRARHQISESEFANTFDALMAHEEKMASQYSDYKKQPITPELIAEVVLKDRIWDAASSKLDSLGLGLTPQARNERLSKLTENAHQLGLTIQDVLDTIDEVWGSKNARRIVQEKQKQAEEFKTGKKEVPQVGPKKEEPMFFEDL